MGPVRMISSGHELTTDYDEKTLHELGFKDMQVLGAVANPLLLCSSADSWTWGWGRSMCGVIPAQGWTLPSLRGRMSSAVTP